MPGENEKIYDSGPSRPSDSFWLRQGEKMVEESLASIRGAAKSLMTGLGLLKGIYLGILGFGDFVPQTLPLPVKGLFILPLLFWLGALYCCLCVMMTKKNEVNLHSPDDIREKSQATLKSKQGSLVSAFWLLAIGLIAAILLVIYRLQT